MVYAGSLERLDFSDEGEEKGFCLVDIPPRGSNAHAEYEFHGIPARRFTTIKVEIDSQDDDATFTVLQTIAQRKSEIKDAIVRLQISLPQALENSLRESDINQLLKEAHHVMVAKEVRRGARLRLGEWAAEELTPLEALGVYLKTKEMPEERRDILLKYGEQLIREKEAT